jgi:hypothetical protein
MVWCVSAAGLTPHPPNLFHPFVLPIKHGAARCMRVGLLFSLPPRLRALPPPLPSPLCLQGAVIESGNHGSLLASQGSVYAKLVRSQSFQVGAEAKVAPPRRALPVQPLPVPEA